MNDIAAFKKDIPYQDLDQNVARLVKVMNDFPGMLTLQCCGGHDDPDQEINRVPKGYWYITFRAEDLLELSFLAFIAREFDKVSLEAFYDPFEETFDQNYLLFALKGRDVDPNEIADLLRPNPTKK